MPKVQTTQRQPSFMSVCEDCEDANEEFVEKQDGEIRRAQSRARSHATSTGHIIRCYVTRSTLTQPVQN